MCPSEPSDPSAPDIALAPEHRQYVLDVFPILTQLDFYELLGVPRDAQANQVKQAYFRLSRVVHPDRYYGKQLGPFKPKLDAIFARVSRAYEVLSAPERRAEYDAKLAVIDQDPRRAVVRAVAPAPALPVSAPAQPTRPDPRLAGTSAAAEAAAVARKQAAMDALRQRFAPGAGAAARHAETAARARASGDLAGALQGYQLALTLAPDDAAIRAAHDQVAALVAERRCEAHRRQAALAEQHQRWAQAAASWRHVTEARPDDAEARARLAAALARVAAGG